jgi:hypothetical protein
VGGDTNLFGYVANDPINWIDINGANKNNPGYQRIPDAGGGGGNLGGYFILFLSTVTLIIYRWQLF